MNLDKHRRRCTVCKHPQREEIEDQFLGFQSPRSLERKFELPETSVYRHAKALRLYSKRENSLVVALGRIIEKGVTNLPQITATNLIEAIKAQAKLTGQWIDRTQAFPAELQGKTDEELDYFATHGVWPAEGGVLQ